MFFLLGYQNIDLWNLKNDVKEELFINVYRYNW